MLAQQAANKTTESIQQKAALLSETMMSAGSFVAQPPTGTALGSFTKMLNAPGAGYSFGGYESGYASTLPGGAGLKIPVTNIPVFVAQQAGGEVKQSLFTVPQLGAPAKTPYYEGKVGNPVKYYK
jgi:hypothetical protein